MQRLPKKKLKRLPGKTWTNKYDPGIFINYELHEAQAKFRKAREKMRSLSISYEI